MYIYFLHRMNLLSFQFSQPLCFQLEARSVRSLSRVMASQLAHLASTFSQHLLCFPRPCPLLPYWECRVRLGLLLRDVSQGLFYTARGALSHVFMFCCNTSYSHIANTYHHIAISQQMTVSSELMDISVFTSHLPQPFESIVHREFPVFYTTIAFYSCVAAHGFPYCFLAHFIFLIHITNQTGKNKTKHLCLYNLVIFEHF